MKLHFRVKFKELNRGRDGGEGKVKSYRCFAKNGKDAVRRLRKKGRVVSVRKIPNNSR